MGVPSVRHDTVYPIVTQLRPDAWERALRDAGILEEYDDIPVGLREGFRCGLEHFSLSCTSVPRNHFTAKDDEEFVIQKYAEEIELGRLSHGYEPDELFALIGHFRTAPLAVVDSANGKRRVIVNHSYPISKNLIDLDSLSRDGADKLIIDPTTTSINTVVDSTKFQCAWGSFSECYLLVADAPPGTEAAVLDVDSAFRNIPTHPSARRFLAIMIRGLIHLDHVLNFGASPAPGVFGRVADAMVKILLHQGVDALIKWVDDFISFRYPISANTDGSYNFSYSADLVWEVARELGWPWAPAKFVDFSTAFMYIGFWWDLAAKTVELPAKKKAKYLARIEPWLHGSSHTVTDAEKIIGTFNHVALAVPEGRSRLVSLYKFRAGFKATTPFGCKHKLSSSVVDDICWWRETLSLNFVGLHIKRPPPPSTIEVFVDASTSWGIGLIIDGKWLAWKFREGWKSDGRDIGWGEMVAVELAVRTLITAKFEDCHIVIRSDNKGVVGALAAGRSRGTQQNAILRQIVRLLQDHTVWVSTVWIATLENPADGPSRGVFPARSSLYAFPPKVPHHLRLFVENSVTYHDV